MLVQTAELTQSNLPNASQTHQIYNGLDCCLTGEILDVLREFQPRAQQIYSFEKALQGPYLEMMQRGFLVDQDARARAAVALRVKREEILSLLNELARAVWDKDLNPQSPKQLAEFFFSAMRLPEVWLSKKGEKKLSTSREALEKLDHYLHAQPFISCILGARDLGKQLEIFECDIDTDNRFRAAYNIAGTETGRPSSSANAFGTGRSAQNIAASLRYVFSADRGMKMCVVDLEQVEARDVGFLCGCLFNDWTFLDACESGDLHTNNAKRIWSELGWTGNPGADRKLADRLFYREFSYRDMAKRGSHLSNYSGTAWTAARSLKVPIGIMEEFQARYIRGRSAGPAGPAITPAFPCIPRWWQWTATQLQTKRSLTTPFGRTRQFFGRPEDATTLREAIAFVPQSTTADRMNLGLWRVWRYEPQAQLLAQTYDSITFQAPDDKNFDGLVSRVLKHIEVELRGPNGRSYVVPGEAKVGWNWGAVERDKEGKVVGNLEGLVKWKPGADGRKRAWGLERLAGGGR